MNNKEQILKILKENKLVMLSGTKIAKELNISRMYVSKAITELINEGYDITIKNRAGYIYQGNTKILDKEEIKKNLDNEELFEIVVLDKTSSTNDVVKELNKENNNKIIVAIADEQTSGKGRIGRKFVSNKGKGIYMSILFKPSLNQDFIQKLTTKMCVAVALALEDSINEMVKIKWVNDIYLNNKKICGIITTGSTNLETNSFDYLTIGIGINTYCQTFSDELKEKASSIEQETNVIVSRNKIIAEILNKFVLYILKDDYQDYMDKYRKRLFMKGKLVEMNYFDHVELAKIIDVDDDGRLIIEENGIIKKVNSGEILRVVIKNE